MNRNLYANFLKIQRLLCKAIYVFMRRVLLSLFRFKGETTLTTTTAKWRQKKREQTLNGFKWLVFVFVLPSKIYSMNGKLKGNPFSFVFTSWCCSCWQPNMLVLFFMSKDEKTTFFASKKSCIFHLCKKKKWFMEFVIAKCTQIDITLCA